MFFSATLVARSRYFVDAHKQFDEEVEAIPDLPPGLVPDFVFTSAGNQHDFHDRGIAHAE